MNRVEEVKKGSCKFYGSVAGASLGFMLSKDNASEECKGIIQMAAFILSWERTIRFLQESHSSVFGFVVYQLNQHDF